MTPSNGEKVQPLECAFFKIDKVLETGSAEKIYKEEALALKNEIESLREQIKAANERASEWEEWHRKSQEHLRAALDREKSLTAVISRTIEGNRKERGE